MHPMGSKSVWGSVSVNTPEQETISKLMLANLLL